ncbi:MAG: methyltransferase domain-containing protein [Planctomycetes bacterium]|jgi:ubiquinone/menaquinone biosynthesis C-methylase UbiE|nr:methyltransferase domain-containing protein [Planctomycetota bacterium]
MDREQRERIMAAYRGWAGSYDRLLRRTYSRVERAITRRHLLERLPERPDASLLDLGGGDARQAIALLAAGRAGQAIVLDLSEDMLGLAARRAARAGAHVSLLRGDAAAIPILSRRFDLVLALGGVLSHFPEPGPVLSGMRRVLRPGGRIVVSVDNLSVGVRTACREKDAAALEGLLTRGVAAVFHRRPFPFPVRFFTPGEIRSAVEDAGFRIESMIGKPVFTWFAGPKEVLSGPEVPERVELEWPFARDPRFWPYADQLELVASL